MFRVSIDPTFRRRFRKKSVEQQGAVLSCIDQLTENPNHPGLRCRRISGRTTWEARIDGKNRIEWEYGQPNEIRLLNNCSHDLVYR